MFAPLLAVENILGIIILVLSILGWFVKAVKDQQAKAPRPDEPRKRPEQTQTEIQDFLDELSGAPPKRPAPKPAPPQRPRPPVAKTAHPQSNKKRNKPSPAAPKPPAKPMSALSEQHLASANLGSGLRTHVSTYMQADRVEQEVRADLKNRIADGVQSDLGSRSANMAQAAPAPVHPLVKLLREPANMRQAIILQDVLQKPRALRRG